MKALIGGAAAVAALGGALLLANTRTTTSAVQANPAQTVASTSALAPTGPTYVDCGPGRIAMFRPALAGQAVPQVECVVSPNAMAQGFVEPNTLMAPGQYPVQAQQPIVQERIVYRDRPVTRTVARSSPRRTVSYQTAPAEVKRGRTWKKSALIIGGAAAGGAGVGAILGGGSGAKKGAVVGGIGGLVYDLATRNK
jgi:hypothetical protein